MWRPERMDKATALESRVNFCRRIDGCVVVAQEIFVAGIEGDISSAFDCFDVAEGGWSSLRKHIGKIRFAHGIDQPVHSPMAFLPDLERNGNLFVSLHLKQCQRRICNMAERVKVDAHGHANKIVCLV